jgi:hypothetical protein
VSGDPVSWLLIEPGWEVVTAGGEHAGTVAEVVGDTGKDIFNGLSVAHGLLRRPRYVPSESVGVITEGSVALTLTKVQFDHLEEYAEPPPSEQFQAP